MSLEEIETLTLGLSDAERAWLAGRLLASLDGPREVVGSEDADIEKLWAAEIERRVLEIDSGSCQLVSAEQVHREIRTSLKR